MILSQIFRQKDVAYTQVFMVNEYYRYINVGGFKAHSRKEQLFGLFY